jgi:[ribosomal protein S5]-alanine N-acetyltransferase
MLQNDDLENVLRQFSDPEMCRYFSEPPMDRQAAMETIQFFQFPEHDTYFRYALIHNDTGEFIGTCGYHHLDRDLEQVELGYDVWKTYWGQGYATESLESLIRICFEHLEVNQVYVLIHVMNTASIRTAAKFQFEESAACRPLDAPNQVCMKLTRTVWEQGTLLS